MKAIILAAGRGSRMTSMTDGNPTCLVGRDGDPLLDAEAFRRDDGGRLLEIGGKPKSVDKITGQCIGLLRFTRARDTLDMTTALQRVIDRGHVPVDTLPYDGIWGEIVSVDDIAEYQHRVPA